MRRYEYTTSSAVNGLPSWKVTPRRRWKVQRALVGTDVPRLGQRGPHLEVGVGFDQTCRRRSRGLRTRSTRWSCAGRVGRVHRRSRRSDCPTTHRRGRPVRRLSSAVRTDKRVAAATSATSRLIAITPNASTRWPRCLKRRAGQRGDGPACTLGYSTRIQRLMPGEGVYIVRFIRGLAAGPPRHCRRPRTRGSRSCARQRQGSRCAGRRL